METKNAYLIENCTGHWQNESLTFVMIDDCYAVGSDGDVYQVIDFNPVEEEDAPQANWLVYTDGQGTYFNYAEDDCISSFLEKEYEFDVKNVDDEEVFELLSQAYDMSDFITKVIKKFVEETDEKLEVIDLTEEYEAAVDSNVENLKNGVITYGEIYNSILDEKEKELKDKGYEILGVDNDDLTDFYHVGCQNGYQNFDIGENDTCADDVALYSGAKICIVIDNNKIYYI